MTERSADFDAIMPAPLLSGSGSYMGWNRTGEWRYFDPVHENHQSPCTHYCPSNVDVQKFISLTLNRHFREAYDTIRETNPLPAICGRVCNRPCETNCNRRELDDTVSVGCLERFIGDWGLKNVKTQPAPLDPAKGAIAVIGSGPAGLAAAWRLVNFGYQTIVFEAMPKAGGKLRVGIPEFRLPRRVLDAEIHSLVDRGVEFRFGVKIGKETSFADLASFRAILIATGAGIPRTLSIAGSDLPEVQQGLDFLAEVNAGKRDRMDGVVAIIGGSNTAVQAARAVLRLGGQPVIYFRRSEVEMTAFADQIEEASREGIEINHLTAPTSICRNGGSLKVTFQRLTLGKKDSAGRRIAVSIHGTQFEVTVARVIVALGEKPDLSFLPKSREHAGRGINTGSMYRFNHENTFAVGDCTEDHRGVGWAVGAGEAVALEIDQCLSGKKRGAEPPHPIVTRFSDLNIAYFPRSQVPERKRIPDDRRLTTFGEVNLGMAEADVLREAARCFSCGVCDGCDNCRVFCPDHAVSRKGLQYQIDYDHCKGCGICIHECPRDAIHLRVKQVAR